jgi:3'-phosphoadenosine 5'-phosphosulfate sulfotransferase (PAPS reductase)/FAD synthetase
VVRDPFKIEGPAVISFSGGRTSGYLLWRILQAHGGKLPPNVLVIFANTGKERLETLDFVERCSVEWGVPVVWVEFRFNSEPGTKEVNGRTKPAGAAGFVLVDYATASRDGEPFEQVIQMRQFLPNPVTRFCTIEMKIRPIQKYIRSLGWDDFDMLIGFRADEPRRVTRARAQNREGYDREFPLFDAGVSEADVLAFWRGQPFDLQLQSHEGNCDLCFLKGAGKIERVLKDRPELADWWIRMEQTIEHRDGGNGHFRRDRPRYSALLARSQRESLPMMGDDEPDELSIACHCTD